MSPPIHLFLDIENVQPPAQHLEKVRGDDYRLWILHGPQQNHFSADRAAAWQPLGKQVRFVQSLQAGKNALDFHLTYCMGEAVEQDRREGGTGSYVVVSRDKGFEALFGYLQKQSVRVGRAETLPDALTLGRALLGDLPVKIAVAPKAVSSVKSVPVPVQPAKLDDLIVLLRDHPRNRPRTKKTLQNFVASHLHKDAGSVEVRDAMAGLQARQVIGIEGTKIQYKLPGPKAGQAA